MAPPLRRRGGRDSFRWLQTPIYGLIIVSFGICIWTTLVFMCINNPSVTCPSCYCDCSYQDFLPISCKFVNNDNSVADNTKIDPEMIEELRKNRSTLLKEELNLRKIVSDENMKRYKWLIENVKKSSSQYQKEADNCNIGVSTCEQARERAQEELVKEQKLTALWQKRAEMLLKP